MDAENGCPNRGKVKVRVTVDRKLFEGDYCTEHAQKLQVRLIGIGMRPEHLTQNAKSRNSYIGASGLPFGVEEARQWLMENGHDVKPRGRLSQELIDLYAEGH